MDTANGTELAAGQLLTNVVGHVASVFACTREQVEVGFTFLRGEPWWTVKVETPNKDKRRKTPNISSGSGESLTEAMANVIRMVIHHEVD